MVAIGINHVVERLAERNEFVHQAFNDLNVCIRFTRTGDDQQLAFQPWAKLMGADRS